MSEFEIIARLVGVFYIYAGYVGLKLMLFDRELDGLMTLLEMKPRHPREGTRRIFLTTGTILTAFSGAALLGLSIWALPLFLLGLAAQLAWLGWARFYYRAEDEVEIRGRSQTAVAALLYAIVTVFVVDAAQKGQLHPWDAPFPLLALGALAAAGGFYIYSTKKKMRGSALDDYADPDAEMPVDDRTEDLPIRQPLRVRIEPDLDGWTLRDADDDRFLAAENYLSPELARQVDGWNVCYQMAGNQEDPAAPAQFYNAEELAAFREQGEAIVAALKEIYGPDNVEGPVYTVDLTVRPPPP